MPSILQIPNSKTRVSYLRALAISRAYSKGQVKVPVLRGVDLCVGRGEFVSIVGKSGCGKSTLMHLFGLLDTPDTGEVRLEQNRIDDLPAATRDELRNRIFGFVFQFYHLLPELTVHENVAIAGMVLHRRRGGYRAAGVSDRARALLTDFGLGHRLKHRPAELSGGERQRVAIARALVNQPRVLLADEPTGNLDRATGQKILDAVSSWRAKGGQTIVMVTHDQEVATRADRVVRLEDGRVVDG